MVEPYGSTAEHIRDELKRLDLLLARHLARWTASRGSNESGGLYISEAQVIRLLNFDRDTERHSVTNENDENPSKSMLSALAIPEEDTPEIDKLNEAIDAMTADIDERHGEGSRLTQVGERFTLSRRERDVLLVALAPELDVKYEKIFAYLQDDYTRKRPTVGLILRVIAGVAGGAFEERNLLGTGGALRTNRLLRISAQQESMLSAFVEVDRRVLSFIIDGERDVSTFDGALERVDAESSPGWPPTGYRMGEYVDDASPVGADEFGENAIQLPLPKRLRERLALEFTQLRSARPTIIGLSGPYGSGRRAVVQLIGDELDQPIVSVDMSENTEHIRETFANAAREALLIDGILHIHRRDTSPSNGDLANEVDESSTGQNNAIASNENALIDWIDEIDRHVIMTGSEALPSSVWARVDSHRVSTFEFPVLSFQGRRSQWEAIDLPARANSDELGSKFRFTPGQIQDALQSAKALATGSVELDDIYRACRAQSRQQLGTLAQRIDPTYGIDDIVLPSDELDQLEATIAQIEHRGRVYSDWGFQAARGGGTGINVLFSGPSGTGKTMAAQIVARETELDLYRIDLATVVSKYIGETEKNIGRIFDEAADSSAIIFFDEADALFGERTEVRDAHDRYANVEINYLLQRMEDHDGVVLLATNFETNLDDAFHRRLDRTIEFLRPDREARKQIWQSSFPPEASIDDLDWNMLAGFDLTGGNIANITVNAAFAAASESSKIEMRHVINAVGRELEKTGKLYGIEDFGEYGHYLQ